MPVLRDSSDVIACAFCGVNVNGHVQQKHVCILGPQVGMLGYICQLADYGKQFDNYSAL